MLNGRSADEHLLLSVRFVNLFRRGGHEHFQPTPDPRHNRGQLARRVDDLRRDEVRGRHQLFVRLVYRAAYLLYLVASRLGREADDLFEFAHLVAYERRRLREVHRRRRDVARHDAHLLCDLLALRRHHFHLIGERPDLLQQRLDLALDLRHHTHDTPHHDRDEDHRDRYHNERNGHDDQNPERRVVRAHL